MKYTGYLFALIFTCTCIYANDAELLSALNTKSKTYSAEFTQTISDKAGGRKDQSKGLFKFKKPYQFEWLTQTPFSQQILSDGVDLWTFDKDLDQVNVQALNKALANTPVFLLTADANTIQQHFTVNKLVSGTSNVDVFELLPNEQGVNFERMLVQFKDEVLSEILLFDTLGQTTAVQFYNAQTNIEFAGDSFQFVITENVDLIDSRERIE